MKFAELATYTEEYLYEIGIIARCYSIFNVNNIFEINDGGPVEIKLYISQPPTADQLSLINLICYKYKVTYAPYDGRRQGRLYELTLQGLTPYFI